MATTPIWGGIMEPETVKLEDLFAFSRDLYMQLRYEDVESLWAYLVTHPAGAVRTKILEVEDSDGEFAARDSFMSRDETNVLLIRRRSLERYGSYLRRIKGNPRFSVETQGLSIDQCALLMEWIRSIVPHLTDYGPYVETLLVFSHP